MKKTLTLALIGYNKVSKSFIGQLNKQGADIKLAIIADDLLKTAPIYEVPFEDDVSKIFQIVNVDAVVLCEERVSKAYEYAREALEKGKHVITNNSTMIAAYGDKLLRIAEDKGVHLRYEAAVLGGAPSLDMLFTGLSGLKIKRLYGALNVPCNYVLDRMKHSGCTQNEAFEDAKELGYCEADYALDQSGKDSLYKMALLKNAAFGGWQEVERADVSSLSVTPVDVHLAQKFGFNIKMLALAEAGSLTVAPTLVEELSQLGNAGGSLSGVVVESENAGPLFMASHGADVEAIASNLLLDVQRIANKHKAWQLKASQVNPTQKPKVSRYFVRLPEEFKNNVVGAKQLQRIEEQRSEINKVPYSAFLVETGMQRHELLDFISNGQQIENINVLSIFME